MNARAPRPRRLFTYIVRHDTGLAPNPYWGACTLAVCTPNHQGSRITPGDWIAGFLPKDRAHRFLYAMEVDEILSLDEYFRDPRYSAKKPNLRGSWKERCGDNFYSLDADGRWIQHPNRFHLDEHSKRQDTRFARVYIGRRFWYLGRSAAELPPRLTPLAGGRGTRVNHEPTLVDEFCTWVASEFAVGVHDVPNGNPDINSHRARHPDASPTARAGRAAEPGCSSRHVPT